MGILTEEELRDRITDSYDEMCLYQEKGDYKKAFEILYEMWELLPGNKIDHEESFSVVAGIIENAIDCGDKEVMRQWIDKMDYIAEKGRGRQETKEKKNITVVKWNMNSVIMKKPIKICTVR